MTTGARRKVRVRAAAKGMNTGRAKYNTATDPTINVIGLMFEDLPEMRRAGIIPKRSSAESRISIGVIKQPVQNLALEDRRRDRRPLGCARLNDDPQTRRKEWFRSASVYGLTAHRKKRPRQYALGNAAAIG
jgi:hypothetical protein